MLLLPRSNSERNCGEKMPVATSFCVMPLDFLKFRKTVPIFDKLSAPSDFIIDNIYWNNYIMTLLVW